jgi:hypothetical protein
MERKDQLALAILLSGAFGGIFLTSLSYRIRDLFFFLMVTLSAVTEYIDVNFVSRDWYRGTTCGFEVSLVDVISLSVLISTLFRPHPDQKRWFWPASLGLMLIYFLFASFCVAVSDPKIFGLFELSKMIRGIIIFLAAAFYLRTEREMKVFLYALATIVCYEGLSAITQRYYLGIHRVYGSVDDSNSLSMYLATTAPVFVAVITSKCSKYLKVLGTAAIGIAFIGVILTISRAGLLAMLLMLFATAIATISYRISLKKAFITLLVMIAMGGALAKAWKTVGERFAHDSLKNEYGAKHVQNRGYYIRIATAIAKDSYFGVGLNNWSYWVSNKYGPRLGWYFIPYLTTDQKPGQKVPPGRNIDDPQAAPAHSLPALTAGEMGVGGLVLLGLLWARWLLLGATFLWPRNPDPMRRIAVGIFFGMCGTLFQSMTEWVFRQTPIYFTFHILLGVLASLVYIRKCERRARKEAQRELEEREEQAYWDAHIAAAENY